MLSKLTAKTPHLLHLHNNPRDPCPGQGIDASHTSWERDLQLSLTDENCEDIYEYAHKGSLNVALQENSYKIATKWYRTPARLHKFSPTIPNTCWRCKTEVGCMLHIWWDFALLQLLWREVHSLLSQITTYTLDFKPAQYLLHHTSLSKRTYYKSLAMFMVNAARLCIPVHWRSTTTLSIREWLTKISKIEEMEELIHRATTKNHEYLGLLDTFQNH